MLVVKLKYCCFRVRLKFLKNGYCVPQQRRLLHLAQELSHLESPIMQPEHGVQARSSETIRRCMSEPTYRFRGLKETVILGNVLGEVESICKVLAVGRWGVDVEQALKRLAFQITPDHVYQVLKRQQDAMLALHFFFWVGQVDGYKHNNLTYNRIVNISAQAQEFRCMAPILRGLQEDRCVLGTITCNTLIQSYGKARKFKEAFAIFAEMRRRDRLCKPDSRTYNLLLHILVKENLLERVPVFYNEMLNAGFRPNIFTCNILMLYLCRCQKYEEGYQWLYEMTRLQCFPNFVTYSTLIDGLCKAGKASEANCLFDRMLEEGISPDVIVFSSLVNGLCKEGNLVEACKLFKDMVSKGCKPNIITFTSLIDSMLKAGNTDEALNLLELMQSKGCAPNVFLYTARIDSLCKRGQSNSALKLLRQMSGVDCVPNTVTYCALVDGYLKAGNGPWTVKLLNEMGSKGCAPNAYLYSSLVYSIAKAGFKKNAKLLVEESMLQVSALNVQVVNSWMSGLYKADSFDEAYRLFNNLSTNSFAPNTITYNILITGFCKSGRVGYARKVFEKMIEQGCDPDLSSYTNLIKGFCKIGEVADACELLLESFKKGFVHVFHFHVSTILEMFQLDKVYYAKHFLQLLSSNCVYSSAADQALVFVLLKAEDSHSAEGAVAEWKKFRRHAQRFKSRAICASDAKDIHFAAKRKDHFVHKHV